MIDPELKKRFEEWQKDVMPYLSTSELTARFLLAEVERLQVGPGGVLLISDSVLNIFTQFIALCTEAQK